MKRILALIMCVCLLPLYAVAEEPWVLGTWTMVYGMQDGKRLESSEIVDGEAAMLRFDADGTATSFIVRNGAAAVDGNAVTWTANGRLITVAGGITVTLQGNGMMRMSGAGKDAFMRRATDEEAALLSAESAEAPADHSWLLGEWVYQYSVKDGERTSILMQPGDMAHVRFEEDGSYQVELVIDGEQSSNTFSWEVQDGEYYANGSKIALLPDGMLQVTDPEEIMYFARPADKPAPGGREQEINLTQQRHEQGAEAPAAGSGWAMTPVDMPAYKAMYGLSPSGRYAILEMEDWEFVLYDLLSGTQTPITYDTARTRSVQDDHQALELLEKGWLVTGSGMVSWSPDERLAVIVPTSSSIMMKTSGRDLYVLDAQTGEVFMPVAWSMDPAADNFSAVTAAVFADNNTIYCLNYEEGDDRDRMVALKPTSYMLYRYTIGASGIECLGEMACYPPSEPFVTCAPNGDLLVIGSVRGKDGMSISLMIGAQNPDTMRVLPLGDVLLPEYITAGANGMAAVQQLDSRGRGMDTVSLIDLGNLPVLATGLVAGPTGMISELPLWTRGMVAAQGVLDQWRTVGEKVKAGEGLAIQYSALSPDGTKLLAITNGGVYMLDVQSRTMKPVSGAEELRGMLPVEIRWGGDHIMIRGAQSSALFRVQEY